MSQRNERINLLVTPEEKEQWEEHANKSGVGTLSALIRQAVNNELEGTRNTDSTATGGGIEEKVGEVLEEVQNLDSRLQGVEGRLNSIEREIRGETPAAELANDVFAILPTEKKLADFRNYPGNFQEHTDKVERAVTRKGNVDYTKLTSVASGRPQHIAKALDVPEQRVEDALDHLIAKTARIQETDDSRYFKDV